MAAGSSCTLRKASPLGARMEERWPFAHILAVPKCVSISVRSRITSGSFSLGEKTRTYYSLNHLRGGVRMRASNPVFRPFFPVSLPRKPRFCWAFLLHSTCNARYSPLRDLRAPVTAVTGRRQTFRHL